MHSLVNNIFMTYMQSENLRVFLTFVDEIYALKPAATFSCSKPFFNVFFYYLFNTLEPGNLRKGREFFSNCTEPHSEEI